MMRKVLERLAFLVLLAYFLYQVGNAGMKWKDAKIGLTVSRGYAEYRLFPSISMCFMRQGESITKAFPDIDSTLNQTRDDVLANLRDKAEFEYERLVRMVHQADDTAPPLVVKICSTHLIDKICKYRVTTKSVTRISAYTGQNLSISDVTPFVVTQ